MRKSILLCPCLLLALLVNKAAAVSTYTWDPQGTNTTGGTYYTNSLSGVWESNVWSTSETGQASPVAWAEGNDALFAVHSGTGTPAFTVTMNSNHTVTGFFDGPDTPNPCPVTITGPGVITVSGTAGFDVTSDSGDPGSITFSNVLAGTGAIVVQEGGGQLYLYGANTYTGGTDLGYNGNADTGIMNFNNAASFGTGPIWFSNCSGAAMVAEVLTAVTIPNVVSNVQTAANTFNIVGNTAGVNFSGAWTFTPKAYTTGQMILSSGGAVNDLVKISGTVTGTNGFTKNGVGMLELTGANTYGTTGTVLGTTVVSNGWLILANTTGSAAGVSSVLITNSGATSIGTLTGNGSMSGTVTNNGGSAISATNMAGGPATLTTGAQTWQPNSHYTWGISSVNGGAGAGWDNLSINGKLTINATSSGKLNIDLTSLAATGLVGTLANLTNSASYSWPILTASGGITGFNPANINLTTTAFSTPSGLGSGVLSVTTNNDPSGHTIYVNFAQPPVPGAFAIGAVEGVATSVSVAKIVSVASTINSGGSLTIASVTSPTANSATVSLSGGNLIYTSAANLNSDTIHYVLTDGFATASGSISVTVTANGTGNNGLTVTPSGGSVIVQAFGIPGQSYYIQVASSVTGPWTDLPGTPVTANSLGQISYTVSDPTSPSYYRTSTTP